MRGTKFVRVNSGENNNHHLYERWCIFSRNDKMKIVPYSSRRGLKENNNEKKKKEISIRMEES